MLPVRVIGGPGRRYRQREQERNYKKKGRSAAAELPEKNAETCFDKMERICLRPLPVRPCQCRLE
jgi:hypothetical protein